MKWGKAFIALAAIAVLAAACGGGDSNSSSSGSNIRGTVDISGSSTVEPISVRAAELFEDSGSDVRVNVDGPGTGDGFKLFCGGDTDISGASRQIKQAEIDDCADSGVNWIELRVAIDGIAVITSAENSEVDCVSKEDLYSLIGPESQSFGRWSDAASLASELGSTTNLPDASLEISGPGEESGTFDSFVELVIEDIAESRGQQETTRPDYSSSADDNVIIQNVQSSDTSLGWVGFAFTVNSRDIKLLEVKDGSGNCIAATPQTIASGQYPISRDLYIYVNEGNARNNPAIRSYVDFYLTDEGLGTAVGDVGYISLDDSSRERTRRTWTQSIS